MCVTMLNRNFETKCFLGVPISANARQQHNQRTLPHVGPARKTCKPLAVPRLQPTVRTTGPLRHRLPA